MYNFSELFKQTNLGVSAEEWTRYHELVAKRRAETLTDPEQTELVTLSDRIEEANVRRFNYLV